MLNQIHNGNAWYGDLWMKCEQVDKHLIFQYICTYQMYAKYPISWILYSLNIIDFTCMHSNSPTNLKFLTDILHHIRGCTCTCLCTKHMFKKEEKTSPTGHVVLNLSWFKTTKRFPKAQHQNYDLLCGHRGSRIIVISEYNRMHWGHFNLHIPGYPQASNILLTLHLNHCIQPHIWRCRMWQWGVRNLVYKIRWHNLHCYSDRDKTRRIFSAQRKKVISQLIGTRFPPCTSH
jgi:hypothetical protein